MSGTYRMRREIGIPPPIAGEAQVRENPVSDQRGLEGILAVWRRSACAALHKAANMFVLYGVGGRARERMHPTLATHAVRAEPLLRKMTAMLLP